MNSTFLSTPNSMTLTSLTHDILVVDDQYDITDMVAEFLSDEGYSVRIAHNGAAALGEILTQPPALLLLDISMPVMSGTELLLHLRTKGFSDLPVILMTAGHSAEVLRTYGEIMVLRKPFDLLFLLNIVERHLRSEAI